MPVIQVPETLEPTFRKELVETLAQEIASDPKSSTGREPVIFQNPIPPSDRFFAVVVWSAWEDLPWGARTGVVFDAYRRADELHSERVPLAPRLATANGLTWEEADENGFFHYAIEAQSADPLPVDGTMERAMRAAGGWHTPDGIKLRYLDRRTAQAMLKVIGEIYPSATWALKKLSNRS